MNTEQIALALASFGREVVGRGVGGAQSFREMRWSTGLMDDTLQTLSFLGALISLWKGEFNINYIQETRS